MARFLIILLAFMISSNNYEIIQKESGLIKIRLGMYLVNGTDSGCATFKKEMDYLLSKYSVVKILNPGWVPHYKKTIRADEWKEFWKDKNID